MTDFYRPRWWCLGLKFGFLLWVLLARMPVIAQEPTIAPSALQSIAPEPVLRLAYNRLRHNQPGAARDLLEPLVDRAPAYESTTHGAAAYWLGRAYKRLGNSSAAREAWTRGTKSLHQNGRFSVQMADAYLQSLMPGGFSNHSAHATAVYRRLLGAADSSVSAEAYTILRRYVAQMAPLMRTNDLQRVIKQTRDSDPSEWTFRAGAGEMLQTWWRRHDPHPATVTNERLYEHLARLVHAQHAYACPSRTSGLDDRGQVYLRFGSPSKEHHITYSDGTFFREVFRFGVAVSPQDFPANVLWLYPHIDRSGYYLFVKHSECFLTGKANDLLPPHLRKRRSATERGLNIAYSSLMAMRYIYRELALYHSDFSTRFAQIAKYADWQTTQASIAEAREATGGGGTSGRTVGAGTGQERRVFANAQFGIMPPNRFIDRMVKQAEQEDDAAAIRRKAAMPRQRTALRDGIPSLPVAVRTARFLTPEGATRTQIYWGLRTTHLQADSAPSTGAVMHLSGTRYDAAYQPQHTVRRQYAIRNATVQEDNVVLPPPLGISGTTAPYHLALQWLQFDADAPADGTVHLGDHRTTTVARVDSLQPLQADSNHLEMSDLQVRLLADQAAPPTAWEDVSKPYPFRTVDATTALVFYFEVYHLLFGADDRTRYRITYQVETRTDAGWNVVAPGTKDRVGTAAAYSGTARRTREFIMLDLARFATDHRYLRITVRVTDSINATTVKRSVDFQIVD